LKNKGDRRKGGKNIFSLVKGEKVQVEGTPSPVIEDKTMARKEPTNFYSGNLPNRGGELGPLWR